MKRIIYLVVLLSILSVADAKVSPIDTINRTKPYSSYWNCTEWSEYKYEVRPDRSIGCTQTQFCVYLLEKDFNITSKETRNCTIPTQSMISSGGGGGRALPMILEEEFEPDYKYVEDCSKVFEKGTDEWYDCIYWHIDNNLNNIEKTLKVTAIVLIATAVFLLLALLPKRKK